MDEEKEDFEEPEEEQKTLPETEPKEGIPKNPIKFFDKRKTNNVNRELVLSRLDKFTNNRIVEKKRKTITPEEAASFRIPAVPPILPILPPTTEPIIKIKKKLKIVEALPEKIEKFPEEEKKEEEETEEEFPEELPDITTAPPHIEVEELPEILPEKIIIKPKRGRPKKNIVAPESGEPAGLINEPPEPPGIKAAKKTRKIQENVKFGEWDKQAKINGVLVSKRLPKPEKITIRTSDYYMNNRKIYVQKMTELFKPYRKELLNTEDKSSCSSDKTVDFKLLTHQKVVRDYLNTYTPYRGLLLYHMLGSGKSCSSIAMAEGMKSNRSIVLMTPASLKMNFFGEIKKCGDLMYRRNQFWEFISVEGKPDYVEILSDVLLIPPETIKKNGGAWLVDITNKNVNFNELTSEQQKSIDQQLDMMIRSKYLDINYNGLNRNKLIELTDNFTKNPFDDVTVIIDEAHNLVSRIVNKLKKPNTVPYILYDLLLKAKNTKVILVTGTPMINYPNELGILFNILRGYIRKWTYQLSLKSSAPSGFKLNQEEIIKIFDKENLKTYDYVEFSGNKLVITRNPFGFVNTKQTKKEKEKQQKGGNDGNGGNSILSSIFGGKTKKKIVIKKTTSSKRNTRKHTKMTVQEIPKELEIEPEATIEYYDRTYIDPHKGGNVFDEYSGVTLDEAGNISDEDFNVEIRRILNKHHIEIMEAGSLQEELKALPDDSDTFKNLFIDSSNFNMKNENTFKKRILGLTSYFKSGSENLLPNFVKNADGENYHIIRTEMSDFQFKYYELIRKEEAKEEKRLRLFRNKPKKNADDLYNIPSTYCIFSRVACNFVFPNPPGRPMPNPNTVIEQLEEEEKEIEELSEEPVPIPTSEKPNLKAMEEEKDDIEKDVIEKDATEGIVEGNEENKDYSNRIKAALKMLQYDPNKRQEEQYLNKQNLKQYSPKFLQILENIQNPENKGLHLLYSQFRTIEGIGVLKLILETNGFAEFKIKKNDSTNMWEIDENEGDEGKPKFILYTGTETVEEKEILRNIYNSSWEVVPTSITQKLQQISSNNFYGEIIKMIMITSSGAEGINLRNTRFVHIVEPYWHMVRLEQVIGRARRICSHQDLPEEERTVKVFLYLSVFSQEQKTNKKNIEIINRDVSRIDGRPVSTDENLFDISILKQKINNQLLNSVKETAIDCNLYNPTNKEENLVCYGFGKVTSNAFSSHPEIEKDLGEMEEINIRKEKLKLKASKPIDGVIYAIEPKTMTAYDMESYKRAQEGTGELIAVGKIRKVGDKFTITFD